MIRKFTFLIDRVLPRVYSGACIDRTLGTEMPGSQ